MRKLYTLRVCGAVFARYSEGNMKSSKKYEEDVIAREPKILFLDIENTPNLGWVWGKWEQNVIEFDKNWHLLTFAVKWFHESKVKTYALCDFPGYKKNREDDKKLARKLWEYMNEADIIIAHNGDAFDIPKANTRFVANGFNPPAPFKSIDTLKIARRYFRMDSNKLDDIGQYLNVGRKLPHTGFALWKGCMNGDKKSWALMKKYNAQDVLLLERIYLKLRQWNNNRPNLNVFSLKNGCPTCGSQHVQKRGYTMTASTRKRRYQCMVCGAWSVGITQRIPGLVIR